MRERLFLGGCSRVEYQQNFTDLLAVVGGEVLLLVLFSDSLVEYACLFGGWLDRFGGLGGFGGLPLPVGGIGAIGTARLPQNRDQNLAGQ